MDNNSSQLDFSTAQPVGGLGAATSAPNPPAAPPQPASPGPSGDLDFSTAQPVNVSSTPQTQSQTPPSTSSTPSSGGFFSDLYDTTIKGMVDTGKSLVTRPIDLYSQAIDASKKGDWKTAGENALKLMGVIPDKEHPLYKAAEAIIMNQVNKAGNDAQTYAQDRASGHGVMASTADALTGTSNRIQQVRDTLKNIHNELSQGNTAGAAGAAVAGGVKQDPLMGSFLGDATDKGAQRMHEHNFGAAAGDYVGAALNLGALLVPGADEASGLEKAAEDAPNKLTQAANTVNELEKTQGSSALDVKKELMKQVQDAHQAAMNQVNDTFSNAYKQINATHQGETAEALASQAEGESQALQGESTVNDLTRNAPADTQIASDARTQANTTEQAMHDTYQEGIDDLKERLDGTADTQDNPLAEKAKEILAPPNPEDHPVVSQAEKVAGDQLDPSVRKLVEMAAGGEKVAAEGDEAAAGEKAALPYEQFGAEDLGDTKTPEAEAQRPYNVDDLIRLRQAVRKAAAGYEPADVNARALRSLLDPIDETIDQVAQASGDEEAVGDYQNLRENYKAKRWAYDDPAVESLQEGKLSDVDAKLMGKQATAERGSIPAMKTALGDKWNDFVRDSAHRLVADTRNADGTLNYKGALNKLARMPAENRVALYGDHGQELLDALNDISQGTDKATQAGKDLTAADATRDTNLAGAGKTATGKTAEINNTISSIIGDGDITKLIKDTAIDADGKTRLDKLTEAVGPDGLNKLFNMALDNKIVEATTTKAADGSFVRGPIRPEELLDWWNGFKDSPEAQKAFSLDPETAARYAKVMKDVENVDSVKKLIGNGVLTAGALAGVAGVAHFTAPLEAMIAGLGGTGLAAKFGYVKRFLDALASRRGLWKTVEAAGSGIEKPKSVGSAIKEAPGALRTVPGKAAVGAYEGARRSLGGN